MYLFCSFVASSFHNLTTRWFHPPQHPDISPTDGSSPISTIPDELVVEIFLRLRSKDDINLCRKVCRRWTLLASDRIFMQNFVRRNTEYIRCNVAFGCDNWTKCFGENAISDEDRNIERETFPNNIFDILDSKCLVFPEQKKKVGETHMLVFIPKTINGESLTLNKLGKWAKQYFSKDSCVYGSVGDNGVFWPVVPKAIGNNPVDKAGWVLMTTHVLEGSRNKKFDDQSSERWSIQKQCMAELAEKAGCEYIMPPALYAATCILAQYFKDPGKRLFSDNPLTYTLCQENVNGYQIVVGGFDASGCFDVYFNFVIGNVGVAALRKF